VAAAPMRASAVSGLATYSPMCRGESPAETATQSSAAAAHASAMHVHAAVVMPDNPH